MSKQEQPNHEMIVVSFADENRADEVLDTIKKMEELDQFAGGTILHHTLSDDVYEKLSAAVED